MGELEETGKRVFGKLFGVTSGGDDAGEVESEENDVERLRRCWVEIGIGFEWCTSSLLSWFIFVGRGKEREGICFFIRQRADLL